MVYNYHDKDKINIGYDPHKMIWFISKKLILTIITYKIMWFMITTSQNLETIFAVIPYKIKWFTITMTQR